jgi:cell wall-associated NlpC family hydrolase
MLKIWKKTRQVDEEVRSTGEIRVKRVDRLYYKLLRNLPSVMVACVLSGLVLFLILGNEPGSMPKAADTAGTTGSTSDDGGQLLPLEPGSFNFEDVSPLNRSGSLIGGQETAPSEPTSADPTEAAETVPAPSVTLLPTPYPLILDKDGVPQERMPAESFFADDALYYVKGMRTNVREMPNTDAPVVTVLKMGDQVTRTGYGLDWSYIETASGQTGYVLTSLITMEFVPTPTPSPTPKPTPKPRPKVTPSPVGSTLTDEQKTAIVDLAKSLIGTRYRYGSMSPTAGFDCSGFTSYIYKTLFNITLPRSARDQAKAGVAVSSKDIEIGDIICFDWDSPHGVCDHVGIYIGGGRYIHASHSHGRVLESTVVFGQNPIVSIRRIIY